MPSVRQTILVLALTVASASAAADTLVAEAIAKHPENSAAGLRPKSGITMAQVEQKFGAPVRQIPQVGDPPITRWVYDRFTVYFENDRVIHSVVHRDPQQ